MKHDSGELEALIKRLLADPAMRDDPLYFALSQLWQQYRDLLNRVERITHVSDAYQHIARQREQSLSMRFDKHLRQLEKVARISDRYQQMLRDLNTTLQEASTHDALTGLANRRLLLERLKSEAERSERNQRPFCVAMVDIDHFKRVNDQYGHDAGDAVLIDVAQVLESEVREYDLCGRWGGEEFLILLPETELATALAVLERVRDCVRQRPIQVEKQSLTLTVSAGLAEHRLDQGYADTVNQADAAMLVAKRSGRDRCWAGEAPPTGAV
ncbi:GGDEF domain-containing protein [Chitinimonas arctica]|uniref:diguanylate cyclase n=1 Tax=Chitinimonas arctica TaxID=2594795 RepID=A0A516SDB1_9NEIS|nr:biofilm regulation diguanylate cyclase SiaD [Chitinimonas arctica]QDQ26136.1 GGDEF domain-containing protein [Chitinimonas arctica]